VIRWVILFCLLTGLFSAKADTLRDDINQPVEILPPATRVLTLSPHTTELLFAAGGADLLIAAPAHAADLPGHAVPIATLGGIDREQVLALSPDLVLAWASGNRASDLAWLGAQGIRVYQSEPQNMRQIAQSIRAIGQLIGRPDAADEAAAEFLAQLEGACAERAVEEVYVSIWERPAMSVGGRHWLNDALAYAGLQNTYAAVARGVFAVERESLLSRSDLLQVAPQQARDSRNGRVSVEALSRPGPALAEGIARVCRETAARPVD
jgi:iron complex transport system substrate-binding protein